MNAEMLPKEHFTSEEWFRAVPPSDGSGSCKSVPASMNTQCENLKIYTVGNALQACWYRLVACTSSFAD
jgi:hypothetical protein